MPGGVEGTPYTYSAPTFATVGVASGAVIAANTARQCVVIINDSTSDIYLAVNAAAVLNRGILVRPGCVAQFGGEAGLPLTRDAINGIANVASRNVTIQEMT